MKRKSFYDKENAIEDLLNPVRATLTETCDSIEFGKEENFIMTEEAAAIPELKSGEVAGENKI